MTQGYNAALHRFAVFTAACTLFLVVAGALVTSNDAGLAVPDWPLSYGSLMPPMVGGIFYEHGHRMIATFVGMLTIALAVWLQLREPRRWMRRLGWVALAAVVAQGLLGGLTVLFFLPRPVSIAHASLAQLFFCTTVAIAFFTSRWWISAAEQRRGPAAEDLRRFALAVVAVIFFQLVLGASYRHRAVGILPHIVWAFVVLGFSIALSRKVRLGFSEMDPLRRAAGLRPSISLSTSNDASRPVTRTTASPSDPSFRISALMGANTRMPMSGSDPRKNTGNTPPVPMALPWRSRASPCSQSRRRT